MKTMRKWWKIENNEKMMKNYLKNNENNETWWKTMKKQWKQWENHENYEQTMRKWGKTIKKKKWENQEKLLTNN